MIARVLFSLLFGLGLLHVSWAQASESILPKSDRALTAFDKALAEQPVYDRLHPGFHAPPMRLDDFLVAPSAQIAEVFNDNIFATKNNTKTDFITTLTPRIDLNTLNIQRGFHFSALTKLQFYHQHTGENTDNYSIDLAPYWTITHALKMTGRLAWEQNHEARTAEDANINTGTVEPVTFHRTLARLGWDYKSGKIGTNIYGQSAWYDFDNVTRIGGGTVVNDDRNRLASEVGLHLSCDVSDRSALYTELAGFFNDYRRNDYNPLTASYSGPSRDAKGVQSVIGMKLPLTNLVTLDASGGYRQQNFDDPAFDPAHAWVAKVKMVWLLTPLTTLNFSAERQLFETIQIGASSFIQNIASIRAYHELRRNIILDVGFSGGHNDYRGINRRDDFMIADIGARYDMNRFLHWRGSYDFDRRSSNDNTADYNRQRIFISARVDF